MEGIPFNRPCITEAERKAVNEVLSSLWLTTGPKVKEFEQRFAELTGAQAALALNSCTAGLHLGLKALGVGPGDEVITTPLTFCATANVIEHLGATTVLADIDPKTWLIDPLRVQEKITSRTKVILPVHYAGNMADMDSINRIAQENNIFVLEDCAHCLPNTYSNGQSVGNTHNLCSFSFYANKNITTGEGGMLTGPVDLVEQCRSLSLHGMDRNAWKRFEKGGSWQYDVIEPGFKYNMTDIQAAMGLVQLSRLHEMHAKRKLKSLYYREQLSDIKSIDMPSYCEHSSFHIFPISLNKNLDISRNIFIETLKNNGVMTSVHYRPIHHFTYYMNKYGWQSEDYKIASYIGENTVTLPLYPDLSQQQQERVIREIKRVVEIE
jgi:dTDP-4-amino-4,6-dideoxygalactose transaminase